ncbi:MAG: hypothetical protein JNM56_28080, partial [Planctomycetia bacterium]|nr:hypothetical protein [Planctomycetia bacterium]
MSPASFSAPSSAPVQSLEDFLASLDELPPMQLLAVLRRDQHQRWQQGEPIAAEDYLQRLPALRANREYAIDLIYSEYLLRAQRGEAPAADEYARRFPEFASELHLQVAVHDAVAAPTPDWPSTQPSLAPSPVVQPARGHPLPEVPGYELLAEIGRGGMGVVYRA